MPEFDIEAALSGDGIPPDYACPEGLSPEGVKAWEAVVHLLQEKGDLHSGGQEHVFYSPAAWRARGEEYGRESELVILHDGGSHAAYFNYDYGSYSAIEAMNQALREHDLFAEGCTSWYSAVYKL